MSSIAPIVGDLDVSSENFVVEALCAAIDPAWIDDALRGRESRRVRALPAPTVLWIVLLLALFRRHSYVSLLAMLGDSRWARRHWPGGLPPTSAALTQARDRLGEEPTRRLFLRSAHAWQAGASAMLLGGHGVLAMDGSTARTPDSAANRAAFGLPGASRGRAAYPALRLVTLLDVGSRLVLAAECGGFHAGEVTLARELLDSVPCGAVLLLDRNFAAYDFLLDLRRRGVHFVVRVKRTMKARTLRRLGPGDRLARVTFHSSLRRRRPDLPRSVDLREVCYRPSRGHEPLRVFTSLLDPMAVSASEIAAAYGLRWEQETVLDEIKSHLLDRTTVNRPVFFRSMTPSRVRQELYAVLIAHNLVRVHLDRAACASGPRRLSYTFALERIREAVRDMMRLATPRLRERYDALIASIGRALVPRRPGRSFPRAVKIKMSSYPCKRVRGAA
jgi:hypothetical protein